MIRIAWAQERGGDKGGKEGLQPNIEKLRGAGGGVDYERKVPPFSTKKYSHGICFAS